MQRVIDNEERFNLIIDNLDAESMARVQEIISKSPKLGLYKEIKSALTQIKNSETTEEGYKNINTTK